MTFYQSTLERMLTMGQLARSDRILIVGGGELDRYVLSALGFSDVLITNLQPHAGQSEYLPFSWRRADMENLDLPDSSFDWVVEHAALHHLESPHKGLLEMARVAKKGVIAFEARDSVLMRLAVRVGLSSSFELEPAFLSRGTAFGIRDSTVPNYVYRWTEREIEKAIQQRYPAYRHRFQYFYAVNIPIERFRMRRNPILRWVGAALFWLVPFISFILGKQGNAFGFAVQKNTALQPWIVADESGALVPEVSYLERRYDRDAYRKRSK